MSCRTRAGDSVGELTLSCLTNRKTGIGIVCTACGLIPVTHWTHYLKLDARNSDKKQKTLERNQYLEIGTVNSYIPDWSNSSGRLMDHELIINTSIQFRKCNIF